MEHKIGGIICDGPDQSGKTYTCELLHDILGYHVHHFSAPAANTDFKMEYILPILESDSPIIFDRSYVSELVYGDLFRGGSGITPEIKDYIEDFLRARNYILVYFKRKDFEREDHTYDSREEMYTAEQMKKTLSKYDAVIDTINIPKIQVDSFDSDCVDRILKFYKKNNPTYGA